MKRKAAGRLHRLGVEQIIERIPEPAAVGELVAAARTLQGEVERQRRLLDEAVEIISEEPMLMARLRDLRDRIVASAVTA